VQQLSAEELRQFRDWFLEFEWEAWDRQIERDSKAGKQDNMSQKPLKVMLRRGPSLGEPPHESFLGMLSSVTSAGSRR
jgi:hypothetical protein